MGVAILLASSATALSGRTAAAPEACSFGKPHVVLVNARYYENNGGYCPAGRDCTGAIYTQANYHVERGLLTGYSVLLHVGTNTVLWQGTEEEWAIIDDSAFPFCIKGTPIRAILFYVGKNDSHSLVDASEQTMIEVSSDVIAATSGDTYIRFTVGAPGAPSPIANIFKAAEMAWYRLDTSPVLRENMIGVRILPNTTAATFADFEHAAVVVGDGSYYTGAVIHELGHYAEKVAALHSLDGQPIKPGAVDYCYGGSCNHHFATFEYKHTAYVEALANFFHATALYHRNAPQPFLCYEDGPCLGAYDLETSSTPCLPGSTRQEGNATRFLWDLYDTVDDSDFDDTVDYPFDLVFTTTVRSYRAGGDNHQINEPWTSDLSTLDDLDGRSINDHAYHFSPLAGGVYLDEIGRRACLWEASWEPWWFKFVPLPLRWR